LLASPNPFRETITFDAAGAVARDAKLEIYDVGGRRVAEIEQQGAGHFIWDGKDLRGRSLPAGVYLYRLEKSSATGRVVLLR
jgi:flagellar hook assembly protein FlgD